MNYLSNIDLKDRDTQIYAGAAIGAVTAGFLVRRAIRKRRENAPIPTGAYPASELPKDCYDAIIVGAGTCFDGRLLVLWWNFPRVQKLWKASNFPADTSTLTPTRFLSNEGPSGSVCGYYLAKGGAKVALLDKEAFPREKVR